MSEPNDPHHDPHHDPGPRDPTAAVTPAAVTPAAVTPAAVTPAAVTPAAAVCAICGSINDCGIARGDATCWCFDLVVPKSLSSQIAETLRDRACVCRGCVERESRGLRVVS